MSEEETRYCLLGIGRNSDALPPSPLNRMKDVSENITLPQTWFAVGNYSL